MSKVLRMAKQQRIRIPDRTRIHIDAETWRGARQKFAAPRVPQALIERLRPLEKQLEQVRRRGEKALPALPPDQRLMHRLTFGWNVVEGERIAEIGADAWLEEQLQPELIDDFGLEDLLHEALPTLSMSAVEILVTYQEDLETPVFELWLATLLRAVYSPRQLYERMVHFWSDHFSINIFDDYQQWFLPVDHRQVARAHALGRFGDLLRASAHSPAMLNYLTNASNVAEHPNENYARELLELHTMGVDGGYTQQDVREVARCLTGWSISTSEDYSWGTFRYDDSVHDQGSKIVLGSELPAGGGQADGERVLDLLEAHPSTARFISQKLLTRVLGVDADAKLLDQVAGVFASSGGDIRETLRAAVRDIWPRSRTRGKLKRPFHLATSSLRSTFAGLDEPFIVLAFLFEAGHLPFAWGPPNGYPDGGPYWAGLPLPRWNYGQYLLISGAATFDFSFLDPGEAPELIADVLGFVLHGAPLAPARRAELAGFIDSRPVGPQRIYEALALAIAAPEMQYH